MLFLFVPFYVVNNIKARNCKNEKKVPSWPLYTHPAATQETTFIKGGLSTIINVKLACTLRSRLCLYAIANRSCNLQVLTVNEVPRFHAHHHNM